MSSPPTSSSTTSLTTETTINIILGLLLAGLLLIFSLFAYRVLQQHSYRRRRHTQERHNNHNKTGPRRPMKPQLYEIHHDLQDVITSAPRLAGIQPISISILSEKQQYQPPAITVWSWAATQYKNRHKISTSLESTQLQYAPMSRELDSVKPEKLSYSLQNKPCMQTAFFLAMPSPCRKSENEGLVIGLTNLNN